MLWLTPKAVKANYHSQTVSLLRLICFSHSLRLNKHSVWLIYRSIDDKYNLQIAIYTMFVCEGPNENIYERNERLDLAVCLLLALPPFSHTQSSSLPPFHLDFYIELQ